MDEQLWVVWFKGNDGWHATGPWRNEAAEALMHGMQLEGVEARLYPRHSVTIVDITE
ncbi:hypothetical protein [Alicyclobacillus sp. ALC3]|uniref:hypothetical protein n=1 Tax=Alicyclobacillus sp. ALC3 TaxID=2796143 RepID=UPI0023783AE3|nr:hypothetical protein [Alicyclobacillus sp. ALC3]WDL96388.1 hypothetical protein JC200_18990 [Alicyclobacillus sp. ALC3]